MKEKLDKVEEELLSSYEKGEWTRISDHDKEVQRHIDAAKNALKKDKRINIRISNRDLLEIKKKAVNEGIPYQTLISSILHKYIKGRFTENAG